MRMIGMVLALMVLAAGCSQQQIDQTVEQTGKALTRAKDAGFEATAIVIVDPSFACVGFGILSKSMGIVIIQGHVAGIVPPTTQPADQP